MYPPNRETLEARSTSTRGTRSCLHGVAPRRGDGRDGDPWARYLCTLTATRAGWLRPERTAPRTVGWPKDVGRPRSCSEAGAVTARLADRDGRGPFWAACATRDTIRSPRACSRRAWTSTSRTTTASRRWSLSPTATPTSRSSALQRCGYSLSSTAGGCRCLLPRARRGSPVAVHEPVAAERRRGVGSASGRLAVVMLQVP